MFKNYDGSYLSLYAFYTYECGRVESNPGASLILEQDYHNDKLYYIEEGFHSYGDRVDILMMPYGKRMRFVAEFRGAIVDSGTFFTDNLEVVDCVIPKGSKYYMNERDEYVSDKIIVKGPSDRFYKRKGDIETCVG